MTEEKVKSKGALYSKVIWGGVIAIIPALVQIYEGLQAIPADALPPKVQAAIAFVGGILAIFGRYSPSVKKPIEGLV